MLAAKFIRDHAEAVEAMLKRRHLDIKAFGGQSIAEFTANEKKRITLLQNLEALKAKRNHIAKEMAQKKARGESLVEVAGHELGRELKTLTEELAEVSAKNDALLLALPNMLADEVPVGADEEVNQLLRSGGTPRQFSFKPRSHTELSHQHNLAAGLLNGLDMERAARVAGARFSILSGEMAELARALSNFFLTQNKTKGYLEVLPPTLSNSRSLRGSGQLPKFAADVFRLGEKYDNYYLIPTAEVPLVNLHAGEVLPEDVLPRYYTATTSCYRSEAGAAGRDTRGLIRLHEFHKTELVQLVHPETSDTHHQQLVKHSEELLKLLELPYRIMLLSSGDTGFSAYKCYDLEVWFPTQNKYREISSCSNCRDFQARRANIRYRGKDGKNHFLHTLNGSALPIERTLAAILENFQTATGSVMVPAVLQPYLQKQELLLKTTKK